MWDSVTITGLVVGVTSFLLFKKFEGQKSPRHLGVYTQGNYWYYVKFILFYLLLRIRQYLPQGDSVGYGKRSRKNEESMENVQTLSSHPLAIDASYFNGYNGDGMYFGAGIQRRPDRYCESLLFIRLPLFGSDILQWPWSPCTDTFMGGDDEWTASGLKFEMVEPMKKWHVTFKGPLQHRLSGKCRNVEFHLTWQATTTYFDMDTDMDRFATCRAIAREPWSREFFELLKKMHQTHYELYGILEGQIKIEGVESPIDVTLKSMKDRSYGVYRNWIDFHRYILQYFAFDDGTYVACMFVSMPATMTHLICGYVMKGKNTKYAIQSADKWLYELGEQEPPDYFSYSFIAADQRYNLEVELIEKPVYYCGWEWEAKLYSTMVTAKLNGIPGQGMCEFEYRNFGGRQMKGNTNIGKC